MGARPQQVNLVAIGRRGAADAWIDGLRTAAPPGVEDHITDADPGQWPVLEESLPRTGDSRLVTDSWNKRIAVGSHIGLLVGSGVFAVKQ